MFSNSQVPYINCIFRSYFYVYKDMVFLILFAIILVLCLSFGYLHFKKNSWASKIPGPFAFPIIGSSYLFINRHGVEYLLPLIKHLNKYPSPSKFWVGNNLIIIFKDPNQVEKLLVSTKLTQKHDFYDFLKPFGGDGLISGSGPKWKHARRMIQPIFNIQHVSGCVKLFQKQITLCLKELESHVNQPFNVEPVLHKFVADIIGVAVLGTQFNIQKGENSLLMEHLARTYKLIIARIMKPWLHWDFIYNLSNDKVMERETCKVIHGTFDEIAKNGKALGAKNGTVNVSEEIDDFVPSVVPICQKFAEQEYLDDDDLRYNLITLYAASEDTMTAIASAACVCFGMYPEYQDKAFSEIKAVVGDKNSEISYETVTKLVYLDMCIKDVLRLFPIAPVIVRKTSEEFRIDSLNIPAECAILISIFNLHMNSNEWKKPMEFYPDHFLPDAVKSRHLFSYIPFSAGPRGCIGKTFAQTSIKLLMANILRMFRIEAEGKYADIYRQLKADISVRPTCGYQIKLHPRVWN